MKYENDVIGDIVIIKNIIFQNTVTNKKEVDHSWSTGRPCLIIRSDEEYDYFLTLTSVVRNGSYDSQYYDLTDDDILFKYQRCYKDLKNKEQGIKGRVNLQNIYRLPISGHDCLYKIKFKTYKEIVKAFENYHHDNIEEIAKSAGRK